MFSREAATALGEGYLCDGVVMAICKGPWQIDETDRAQIDQGIEYLTSAQQYKARMWNLDSHSLERIRRNEDVTRAMVQLERRGKLAVQDPTEEFESRLARYNASLRRLRDGLVIPADMLQNLPELDELFGEIGQKLLVRAQPGQGWFSDCTLSLL